MGPIVLSSADLFIIIKTTIRVSKSLDPDQIWQFARPDLGPNHLQCLSAKNKNHLYSKTCLKRQLIRRPKICFQD